MMSNKDNANIAECRLLAADDIKRMQVEMMVNFADYCEKHSLTYMLCCGTLLGAVRHKGFIPWDDDVDLMMPRPDYDKLVQLVANQGESISKTIDLLDCRLGNSVFPFVKLSDNRTLVIDKNCHAEVGVWIDIFPIDGNYSNNILNYLHYKSVKVLNKLVICQNSSIDIEKKTIIKCVRIIIAPILKLIPHRFLCNCLNCLAAFKEYDSSKLVGRILMSYGTRERTEREKLLKKVKLEFEGFNFNAPENYDELLTQIYGDYMALPPENQRVNHGVKAYWKDDVM